MWQGLGIVLQALPVRNAEDIDAAFQAADRSKAQVVVSMEDPLIQFHRAHIVELAMKRRLPLMAEFRPIVVAGALLSYGTSDQVDMWRRSSSYVDRILKGANPAELPIERPTRFLLVLNMKTAKALGITIPQSVQLRVDEKRSSDDTARLTASGPYLSPAFSEGGPFTQVPRSCCIVLPLLFVSDLPNPS